MASKFTGRMHSPGRKLLASVGGRQAFVVGSTATRGNGDHTISHFIALSRRIATADLADSNGAGSR